MTLKWVHKNDDIVKGPSIVIVFVLMRLVEMTPTRCVLSYIAFAFCQKRLVHNTGLYSWRETVNITMIKVYTTLSNIN